MNYLRTIDFEIVLMITILNYTIILYKVDRIK